MFKSISVCVCVCSCSAVSDSLQPLGPYPIMLLCPWNFPGKTTGVGCHFLLQGIFPIQELKLHLLHLVHCEFITTCATQEDLSNILQFSSVQLLSHI